MNQEDISFFENLNVSKLNNYIELPGVDYYQGNDSLSNFTSWFVKLKAAKSIPNVGFPIKTSDNKLIKAWYTDEFLIHAVFDFEKQMVAIDSIRICDCKLYRCIDAADLVYYIRILN